MTGTELLVLSPHGHVEHHAVVADDGTTTWLDLEPGAAPALLAFLERMRFLMRVEPADVTADRAVLSIVGPQTDEALGALGVGPLRRPTSLPVPPAKFATGAVPPRPTARYAAAALPGCDGLARRVADGADLLVPRAAVPDVIAALGAAAGRASGRTRRCGSRRGGPRLGFETDHKTLAAEVGWIGAAVHLEKGCYRGQETVARVHHLGRPPRKLVLLHLDGIATDELPAPGTAGASRTAARSGSSAPRSATTSSGQIALAVVKQNREPDDGADCSVGAVRRPRSTRPEPRSWQDAGMTTTTLITVAPDRRRVPQGRRARAAGDPGRAGRDRQGVRGGRARASSTCTSATTTPEPTLDLGRLQGHRRRAAGRDRPDRPALHAAARSPTRRPTGWRCSTPGPTWPPARWARSTSATTCSSTAGSSSSSCTPGCRSAAIVPEYEIFDLGQLPRCSGCSTARPAVRRPRARRPRDGRAGRDARHRRRPGRLRAGAARPARRAPRSRPPASAAPRCRCCSRRCRRRAPAGRHGGHHHLRQGPAGARATRSSSPGRPRSPGSPSARR